MHVASGSWFRGSTSGWAACCHVDHGRFTLKADIATLPRYVRSVPCVDGSELARLFFTFAGWSVQPCVRPHMMVSPSRADLGRSRSKVGLSFSAGLSPANLTSGGS